MPPKYTLDSLRQPEYTGENRCTPCTIVNVAVAAVAALALAVAFPLLGVVAFAAFVAVIYLRGYLVPGTPTLTKRYLPDRVLAWFDKTPASGGYATRDEYGSGTHRTAGDEHALGVAADGVDDVDVDPEETLLGVGALEVCRDGTDLCLTEEFREALYARIDRLRGDDEAARTALASVVDVPPERVSIQSIGTSVNATIDGRQIGRWESRPAFVAEMAAERALEAQTGDWTARPIEQRSTLLSSLRIFLDECPECGGRVSMREETVESCCRSWEVVAGACEACGARVFEIDAARLDGEAA